MNPRTERQNGSSAMTRMLCSIVLLLMAAALIHAQTATTGQVAGTVTDPSGAVVPNARVTLESATGEKREITTSADGEYRFPLIAPGIYQVTITAPGFQKASLAGVMVRITETTRADVHLAVSSELQALVVTAEAPLVQTTNAATGRVIEQAQV